MLAWRLLNYLNLFNSNRLIMSASTCYVLVGAKVIKIFDICKRLRKNFNFFKNFVYWYEVSIHQPHPPHHLA
nr:MAG TPA: hypothetical protein [Crassvirales sp.]